MQIAGTTTAKSKISQTLDNNTERKPIKEPSLNNICKFSLTRETPFVLLKAGNSGKRPLFGCYYSSKTYNSVVTHNHFLKTVHN